MSRLYRFTVIMSVKEGSFTSVQDLLDYMRYRLFLRDDATSIVKLETLCLDSESSVPDGILERSNAK